MVFVLGVGSFGEWLVGWEVGVLLLGGMIVFWGGY